MTDNLNWQLFPDVPTSHFYSQVMQERFWGSTFQSECDWCIGSRYPNTNSGLCFGNPNILPRTIFVQLEFSMGFFVQNILPLIPQDHEFVLIIGDADLTFPQQLDVRYGHQFLDVYEKLVNDNRILHIFCAHLDIPRNEKISPLPVGFDFFNFQPNSCDNFNLDINSKELKIFNCDRIRKGTQWEDRIIVERICSNEWTSFSVSRQGVLGINDFNQYLNKNAFTLCPHGGGLEPNPKVFHALLFGSIPIVKKFVNCEFLYQDLPIVFIPEWKPEHITAEKLKMWRESFKDYFYNQEKREQVLNRLTTDYWKKYIQKQSNADFKIFS